MGERAAGSPSHDMAYEDVRLARDDAVPFALRDEPPHVHVLLGFLGTFTRVCLHSRRLLPRKQLEDSAMVPAALRVCRYRPASPREDAFPLRTQSRFMSIRELQPENGSGDDERLSAVRRR